MELPGTDIFGRLPICKSKRVNSVTSNFHGVWFEDSDF